MNFISTGTRPELSFQPAPLIYRPEIDGLRALAVIPVILFHAGFDTFGGGFVGVDVFFVISGFLITSIIIHELHAGTFSLINFYERRARRILPALTLMLAASSICAFILLWPIELHEFSKSLRYVVAFCSNIFFDKNSGYFDTASELQPLLHTWSLAIEEQYYIALPAALMLAWRYDKKAIFIALGAIALASLAYCEYISRVKFDNTFFLLRARIWELLVGSLVAFTCAYRLHRFLQTSILKQLLSALGVIAIVLAIFTFDKSTPFPGLYALLPTLGTALIILFATRENLVGRLLSLKAFVAIGLISYSLYLWHYPVFVFARHALDSEPDPQQFAALIFLTFILSYLSYKFVELPFRRGLKISTKKIALLSSGSALSLLLLAIAGDNTRGFEKFYFANRATPEIRDINEVLVRQTKTARGLPDDAGCHFGVTTITPAMQERFNICANKYGKAIVIVGDSHAEDIYRAINYARFQSFVVAIAIGGCRIVHETTNACFYADLVSFTATNKDKIRHLIYHQSGSYFLEDPTGKVDSDEAFKTGNSYRIENHRITKTIQYLNKLASFNNVIWLGPFPEARRNLKNYKQFRHGFKMNPISIVAFQKLEMAIIEGNTPHESKFKFIPFSKVINISDNFLRIGDCITYRDTDHLSSCGQRIVGMELKAKLLPLLLASN